MSAPSLPNEIEDLQTWPRAALGQLWISLHAAKPPYGSSQALLARILAYDVQAQSRGGLSERTRRRLVRTARGQDDKRVSPTLKPGARLVREWNGISHIVDIRADGVFYREHRYRSLSSVAKAITGSHWSGPRFFGLINRRAGQ